MNEFVVFIGGSPVGVVRGLTWAEAYKKALKEFPLDPDRDFSVKYKYFTSKANYERAKNE